MVKDFVEYIVKKLVSLPDNVVVSTVVRDGNSVISIQVDDKDRGRVIGKEGQTIKALRTIISAMAPAKQKISIDIQ